MVDAMDGKQSSLREELVAVKEQLNRALLDKEVMEVEKTEVVEALTKVRMAQIPLYRPWIIAREVFRLRPRTPKSNLH